MSTADEINSATTIAPLTAATAATQFYQRLHGQCGMILNESLTGEREQKQGRSHSFLVECDVWLKALGSRPETYLLKAAAKEWQHALLSVAQGQYAQGFRSLRLVLELSLQAIYLSAHLVELREWLENRKETVWNEIVDDDNGVFSKRFIQAFAPVLEPHRLHYSGLAEKVYRECSECVHGNVQKHIVLPDVLIFSEQVFLLWHEKAEVVALVLTFALDARYYRELPQESQAELEVVLLDRLGHLPEIRQRFGHAGGDT